MARRSPADMTDEEFDAYWEAEEAEWLARQQALEALVAKGPHKFVAPFRYDNDVAVFTPDLQKKGQWRATYLDEDGEPYGHRESKTWEGLVRSLEGDIKVEEAEPLERAVRPNGRRRRATPNGSTITVYKVMRREGGRLISGADSRQSFAARRGTVIRMPGHGVYTSPNRDYVLDYYRGLSDDEVLLTLEADENDMMWGNLTDREAEASFSQAKIVDIEPLDDDYEPNKMAPGYQSYGWTTQDWRVVIASYEDTKKGKTITRRYSINYDDKCGAPSNSLPGGRKRLCLPAPVIRKLMRSKKGRDVLLQQARRKETAKPGASVRWHPMIREYWRELEAKTVEDRPQRKNPSLSTPALLEAIERAPHKYGRKTFIVSAYVQYVEDNLEGVGELDLQDFKDELLDLAQRRDAPIELSRADLVGAMDPKIVRLSETAVPGTPAVFHFVRVVSR